MLQQGGGVRARLLHGGAGSWPFSPLLLRLCGVHQSVYTQPCTHRGLALCTGEKKVILVGMLLVVLPQHGILV